MQSKLKKVTSIAYSQVKRLLSIYREVSLRQNREDMKWVDLLMYLSPEETGGSMEFALCDYAFVPAVEAIVVNETLLVCHLIV